MGAFAAGIASGVGKGGEDFATGDIAARREDLNTTIQQHLMRIQDSQADVAQKELALRSRQADQSFQLAQQQHDLYRTSILDAGFRDGGVMQNVDPATNQPIPGSYSRIFTNPRTNETRKLPVPGIPPDSPEGVQNHFKSLAGMKDESGKPIFNNIQAAQIAFRTPQLYREGPAEVYKSFQDIGADKFPDDPDKASKFGKNLWDEYTGKAGFFHYGQGATAGRDMSGFTAGEKREYDAATRPIEQMKTSIMRMAAAEMQATLDPTQQANVSGRYLMMLQSLEEQESRKFDEIQQRRNPNAPNSGGGAQFFSRSQWLAQHPGGNIQQAESDARAAKAFVVP